LAAFTYKRKEKQGAWRLFVARTPGFGAVVGKHS
jgi:hypothetical protein